MQAITTYKGKFASMNITQTIENNTRRMLRNVGEDVSRKMKDKAEKNDYTGSLSDSITWRTAYEEGTMGSNASASDMIDRPLMKNAVSMGSANSHAYFREFGAGPHMSKDGSEEFIADMKEWVRQKIPDMGDPDKEGGYRFWALIKSLREGQEGEPFVRPTLPDLHKIAARESRFAAFGRNMK
jgi:hypothetical protein